MCRGVITRDRVHWQQEAKKEQIPHIVRLREYASAGCAGVVGKSPKPRYVNRGCIVQAGHYQNRSYSKYYVARNIRQKGRCLNAYMVQHGLNDRNYGNKDYDFHVRRRPRCNRTVCTSGSKHGTERALKEIGRADVDSTKNGDQAQQVQPSRKPAPEPVPQNGAPVIQAPSCRESRSDLRHRQGEHPRQHAAHDPANTCASTANRCNRLRERVDAAGQNADDRE